MFACISVVLRFLLVDVLLSRARLLVQYEAFDRYYASKMGAGSGAWGAFTGQGLPVAPDRIINEGEAAIPFAEMST